MLHKLLHGDKTLCQPWRGNLSPFSKGHLCSVDLWHFWAGDVISLVQGKKCHSSSFPSAFQFYCRVPNCSLGAKDTRTNLTCICTSLPAKDLRKQLQAWYLCSYVKLMYHPLRDPGLVTTLFQFNKTGPVTPGVTGLLHQNGRPRKQRCD